MLERREPPKRQRRSHAGPTVCASEKAVPPADGPDAGVSDASVSGAYVANATRAREKSWLFSDTSSANDATGRPGGDTQRSAPAHAPSLSNVAGTTKALDGQAAPDVSGGQAPATPPKAQTGAEPPPSSVPLT